MKKTVIVYFLLGALVFGGDIDTPDNALGITPPQIFKDFGTPDFLYSENNDVVIYYNSGFYIYLNKNRVWQVRSDKSFKDKFLSLSIGDDRTDIINTLGNPYKEDSDTLLYKRPDRGYPVFLRLYFNNNKLNDIYLFRGDY